ncbi:MAG TPA: DUF2934 domain-containing protein [Kiritimatiellae bacterium]|nr:DUF2934 domain-containing protein [Kiritimatiellia bacterium]
MAPTAKKKTAGSGRSTPRKSTRKAARRTGTAAKTRRTKKTITSAERYKMIETAAYLRAEKNDFGGDPVHYWLEAEKEVDAQLAASGVKVKS